MEFENMHWIMSILQNMNTGLVVVDKDYKVHMWNSFMENHSGLGAEDVNERNLFEAIPDLESKWLMQKIDTVFLLSCAGYTIWEERPYVFKFDTARPITGRIENMYQNSTLMPLHGLDTKVSHVAILISDVTAIAVNKQGLVRANEKLAKLNKVAG